MKRYSLSEAGLSVLFNVPTPRQEWIQGKFVMRHEKNDEGWVELYNDLVFVVLLSKLGAILETSTMDIGSYFNLAVLFWVMCLTRQAIDEYANRFYAPDLMHKLLYLAYSSGIFVVVMNLSCAELDVTINQKLHFVANCAVARNFWVGILCGLLITRIALIMIYATVMFHHKLAINQFSVDIARWGVTVTLLAVTLASMYRGFDTPLAMIAVASCVEVASWCASRTLFRNVFVIPINLELMQSRWGVWVMIVVGEAIIRILYRRTVNGRLFSCYAFNLLSFGLMFSLAMQYYDSCQVPWYEHALTKTALQGVLWIWLHVPMTYHLFRVGVMLDIFSTCMVQNELVPREYVRGMAWSLGSFTAILTMIKLTNTKVEELTRWQAASFAFRWMVSVIQICMGYVSLRGPIRLIMVHSVLSICLFNLVDITHDVKLAMHRENTNQIRAARSLKALKNIPRQWSTLHLLAPLSPAREDVMSSRRQSNPSVSTSRRLTPRACRFPASATPRNDLVNIPSSVMETSERISVNDSGKNVDSDCDDSVNNNNNSDVSPGDPDKDEGPNVFKLEDMLDGDIEGDLANIAVKTIMKQPTEFDGFVFKLLPLPDCIRDTAPPASSPLPSGKEYRNINAPAASSRTARKIFLQQIVPVDTEEMA